MCDPVTGATRRRPSGRRAGTTLFKRPTRPTQSLPPHRIEPLESRRLLSAAPLRPDLLASSDSGVSDTDDLTRFDNATPAVALQFLVAGTTPGAAVTLWLDNVSVATATAAGPDTLLALDPGVRLGEGAHSITARQTDPGGEQSPESPPLPFTIDTTAPAAPAAPNLHTASDTGASGTDNLTADNTPTFGAAGAPYYRLLRNGARVSGAYESAAFTAPALADGVHAFTAESVDAAGNASAASPPLQVTVDTAGPAAALDAPLAPPVLFERDYTFSVAYTDPYVVLGSSIDESDVYITGGVFGAGGTNGTGAALVRVTSDPTYTRQVATYRFTAPGGSWHGALNGTYTISLRAQQVRDAAGNSAPAGLLGSVVVDLPSLLAVPVLLPRTDSGVSDSDGVTHFDNSTPGRAPAFVVRNTLRGATITVLADGTAIGSATADGPETLVTADGTLPLPDGHYLVTAEQTLEGRQPVPPSPATRVTIDTVAPPRPPAPDLQAASDSGISDGDNVTSDTTPTLDVPRSLAAYFRVFRDGVPASNPFAAGPSFTAAATPDGVHRFTAAALDAAGNASEQSPPLHVTVDTVAPASGGTAGSLDATFDGDGRWLPDGELFWHSVVAHPNGKLIAAGASGEQPLVTRLNPDGSPDTTFGDNGTSFAGTANGGHLGVLPDGRVVLAGDRNVWRLTDSGAADPTFGAGGTAATDFPIRDLAVAPDAKILLAGIDDDDHIVVARLTPDGAFDTTFGGTGWAATPTAQGDAYAFAVAGMADGRVVVAGYGYPGSPSTAAVVVRFNNDGSPDLTFGTGGRVQLVFANESEAHHVEVEPDGRVLVSGRTRSTGSTNADITFLARLTPGGAPDPLFGANGVVTARARGIGGRLSPNGYFIAASERGDLTFRRYDGAGLPDASIPGGVVTSPSGTPPVESLLRDYAVGPDGKVVLVGYYARPERGVLSAAYRLHGNTFGVPDLNRASDSGVSPADDLTNDATPTFDVAASAPQRQGYLRLYRGGAPAAGDYEPVGRFTAPPQPDGKWDYTVAFVDAAGNVSPQGPALAVTIDTAAPRVAELFASTSAWTDAFTAALAASGVGGTSGFKAPAAEPAAGPVTLPWSNINHFTIRTSEPVVVRQADLSVYGDATGPYAAAGFFRDTAGRSATWVLGRPLSQDEVRLTLADAVTDLAGNRLAGAATGAGASPFQLRLRVAPGDANRNGAVDALDLVSTRARLFTTPGGPGPRRYSVFNDFNGDGRINATDYHLARTRLTARRRDVPPPPAPDDPAPVVPQSLSAARSAPLPRRASLLPESANVPLLPR